MPPRRATPLPTGVLFAERLDLSLLRRNGRALRSFSRIDRFKSIPTPRTRASPTHCSEIAQAAERRSETNIGSTGNGSRHSADLFRPRTLPSRRENPGARHQPVSPRDRVEVSAIRHRRLSNTATTSTLAPQQTRDVGPSRRSQSYQLCTAQMKRAHGALVDPSRLRKR